MGTYYGLGRLFADIGDPTIYFTAVKYELFSQVAGIMVIGIGKAAVGVFLLRIVRNKIQIWFIYGCLAITAIITLFASITVIVQCSPVEKSWNPMTPGTCWVDFSKVGYTVGCKFSSTHYLLRRSNISTLSLVCGCRFRLRDSPMVCCLGSQHEAEREIHRGLWLKSGNLVSRDLHSMAIYNMELNEYPSAGVCGIVRTVALSGLNASEYICKLPNSEIIKIIQLTPVSTDDTVPMLIWSATESLVTIMCSSIPVLRPLYVRVRYGKDGKDSSTGNSGDTPYKLPMYGSGARKYGKMSISGIGDSIIEPKSSTMVKYGTRNTSDENILQGAAGIERTDEISVSYERFDSKV